MPADYSKVRPLKAQPAATGLRSAFLAAPSPYRTAPATGMQTPNAIAAQQMQRAAGALVPSPAAVGAIGAATGRAAGTAGNTLRAATPASPVRSLFTPQRGENIAGSLNQPSAFGAFGFGTKTGDKLPTPFETGAASNARHADVDSWIADLHAKQAASHALPTTPPQSGLLTNEQAAQLPAGRQMPNTTAGGAFGQRIGERQRFNPATSRYEGSQLGVGGYENPQAMAASQFQGATPGLGTSPSGQVRQMFMGPVGGQTPEQYAQMERQVDNAGMKASLGGRVYYDPQNNRVSPSADTREMLMSRGLLTPNTPAALAEKDRQLAINRDVTWRERAKESAQRVGGVEENAAQRQDARRARLGNLTVAERLGFADPRGANMRAAAEAESLAQVNTANADRGLRERLGMGELDVRQGEVGVRQKEAEARIAQIAAEREAAARASGLEALGGLAGGREAYINSGGDPAVYDQWMSGAAGRGGLQTPPAATAPPGSAPPATTPPAAQSPIAAAVTGKPPKTLASLTPMQRRAVATAEDPVKALIAEGITGPELDAALQELSGDESAFREAPDGYGAGGFISDIFGLGPKSQRSWRKGRPIAPGGGIPTLASGAIGALRGALGF